MKTLESSLQELVHKKFGYFNELSSWGFLPILFFKQKPNELRVTTQKREANIPEILHNVYFLEEITFLN